MYSRQKIADWFIARHRAEERLNGSAKPITKMKLNQLMDLAQKNYRELYNECLFDEKSPLKNSLQLDAWASMWIFQERAIQLANNFDQILLDKKASAVLTKAWLECN